MVAATRRRLRAPGFKTGSIAYPRHVIDAQGEELRIARPARALAGAEWTIEEFLYSISPPDQIVAVTSAAYDRRYSNVYELAEKYRPALVGVISPNAELLVKADPELVVAAPEQVNVFNILRGAGIPVYRMYTQFTKLDEISDNILLSGLSHRQRSTGIQGLRRVLRAVAKAKTRKPAGAASPRVLGYQFVYSYGSETIFNDIVKTVGGINVGAEQGLRLYDAINSRTSGSVESGLDCVWRKSRRGGSGPESHHERPCDSIDQCGAQGPDPGARHERLLAALAVHHADPPSPWRCFMGTGARGLTMQRHSKQVMFFAVVFPALLIAAIASVTIGSTHVDWQTTLQVIAHKTIPFWGRTTDVPEADEVIIWLIRVPRVLVAAIVGAGLAIAGAMTQGLFEIH